MTYERIEPEELREWTLMFYFASDNPLAPSIVNQLKALKAAGFHADANVIAHFDPYTRKTRSHVFEVNAVEKRKLPPGESLVGFDARDPFVRNLVLDKIWEEGDEDGEKVRKKIGEMLRREGAVEDDPRKLRTLPKGEFDGRNETSPSESLGAFLKFCRETYPARRYMLFILGHGVVVGNDVFLFDANPGEETDPDDEDVVPQPAAAAPAGGNGNGNGNGNGAGAPGAAPEPAGNNNKPRPRNSLTLKQLAGLLGDFKQKIGDSKFELVSFHSCSMSGVEVAYELQDTAHYMLASQGPAFVGSWPYRQILLKVFNSIGRRETTDADVRNIVRDIFYYVVYNSYDFQLAGYSFDLALCALTKAGELKKPVDDLARALAAGLKIGGHDRSDDAEPLVRELILLAHWDAQSFWQENYTDLYDFCLRLRRRCRHVFPALRESSAVRVAILDACEAVITLLERGVDEDDDDRLIVRAEFVGAEYQYSHGLSIFFPWSRPADRFFERTYPNYRLSEETAWAKFLDEYFEQTLRRTRQEEDRHREAAEAATVAAKGRARGVAAGGGEAARSKVIEKEALELLQVIGTRVFTTDGQLAKNGIDDRTGPPPAKSGPDDPTGGGDCGCPAFKNHPSFTGVGRRRGRGRSGEKKQAALEQPMSTTINRGFKF